MVFRPNLHSPNSTEAPQNDGRARLHEADDIEKLHCALLESGENAAVCHEATAVVNDVQVKEPVVCADSMERAGAELLDDPPRVVQCNHTARQRHASKKCSIVSGIPSAAGGSPNT